MTMSSYAKEEYNSDGLKLFWDSITKLSSHRRWLQEELKKRKSAKKRRCNEDQEIRAMQEEMMTGMTSDKEKYLVKVMRENQKLEQELSDLDQELNDEKPTLLERAKIQTMKVAWQAEKDLEQTKKFLQTRENAYELLPKDFLDDPNICCTVIRLTGYEKLSHDAKCDIRIVKAAFKFDLLWSSIPEEAQNNPDVVVAAINESRSFRFGVGWDIIPTAMQSNTAVAWHAVRKGMRLLDELPFLVSSRESVLFGLNHGYVSWESLNDIFRNDIELARDVIDDKLKTHVKGMLKNIPSLRSDRAFWLRVAKSTGYIDATHIFVTYATYEIRSDAEIVLCLAKSSLGSFLEEVALPQSLWNNATFVASLSKCRRLKSRFLFILPQEKQMEYLDLVLANIKELQKLRWCVGWYQLKDVSYRMTPDLWSDRRVVETWFKLSRPFIVPDPFYKVYSNDKEVFRWIAEHCSWTNQFEKMGPALLDDKEYLIEILQKAPRRYTELPQHIQMDPSMALLFYSGTKDFVHIKDFLENSETVRKFCEGLLLEWETQLQKSNLLFQNSTFFPTLDEETCKAIKMSIANFAGLPEKKLLVAALANMKRYDTERKVSVMEATDSTTLTIPDK